MIDDVTNNSSAMSKLSGKNVEFTRRTKDNHQKSKKLVKRKARMPSFLKTIPAMVVFAKPNGKLNPLFRIVGFSLNEILMNCTQIMKLTSAGRKLYSTNGQLIDSFEKLTPYEEVHVSLGEPFIDPVKFIKDSINIKAESFWGLNGLYIPKSKRKAVSAGAKYGQSDKMWRILTFTNREYATREAIEIVSDLKDIEEVKSLCSTKHNFNGQCKRLFSSNYTEIFDLKSLCNEESFVWNPNSNIAILGPIWASKGEDLNQECVYNYFVNTKKSITNSLRESKLFLKELESVDRADLDKTISSKIRSFSKPELKVKKDETEMETEKLQKTLKKFESKLQSLPTPTPQVITEPDKDLKKSTFKCAKGLRLKVYQNGQDSSQNLTIFFNVHKAKRGIRDSSLLFSRFLDSLSENLRLSQLNDFTKGILVRRVFTDSGQEITDVEQLSYDQLICISYGDDWIDPIYMCACAKIHFLNDHLENTSFDFEVNHKSLKEFELSDKSYGKDKTHILPIFQHQKRSNMFLVTSLLVQDRKDRRENLITSWIYTSKGKMILKSMPSLCLTLLPNRTESFTTSKCSLNSQQTDPDKNNMIEINFYPVQLCLVQAHHPNQIWHFTNTGLLCNQAYPNFYLTFFDNYSTRKHDDLPDMILQSNILAAERLPDDLQLYQRWAFKQETFANLNQWRLCDFPNPEWHKTALTWPLKSNGDLNIDLNWPIEGLLVPCVPPLTQRKYDSESRFPIKLLVFKNNDHTMKKPILVTGPDLSKLIKKGHQSPYETHCTNESLLKLEFQMFLDYCTSSLRLPSSARRLFDQYGDEKFDLEGLANNYLVIVSMGEMWCSPNKTLSRIELRSYANKLAVDIERMKYFIGLQLANEDLAMGLKDSSLVEGNRIEVQLLNDLSKKEIQRIIDEDNFIPVPEPVKEPSIDESLKYKTFHEKMCDAAKLRMKKNNPTDVLQIEEVPVEKIKKPLQPLSDSNLQRFIYKSNKILVMCNQKFCLCVDDIGKPLFIKAMGHDIDNSRFNWIIHKSGLIESVHYRGYVIGVHCNKMLPFHDKAPSGFQGCTLILEKSINTKYGKAHQMFKIDSRSGLFYPFFTNPVDKSITAALLSGVCTKFTCSKSINQQGSLLEINSEQRPSCMSCVAVMNGRFPISALDENLKFTCSHTGGFKVIPKTVDLSISKSEETYQYFVTKLHNIRKQLAVKVCKSRFTAPSTENIQVLLHLNGDNDLASPRRVTGKSIIQIMEMATGIYNLQRPVRILYTSKGEEIFDDLSFRNILCQVNSNPADNGTKSGSIKEEPVEEVINEDLDSNFEISLSNDQRFFIVEFTGKQPQYLYTLEINITGISGMDIFHELHVHPDSAFLFNYEIFNNQINTELFFGDSDFEGEQTELSIKSSPKALKHLFSMVMGTLRLQLISARVNKDNINSDFHIDIESIDALADFHFNELVHKLDVEKFDGYSTKLTIPLLSTETFTATTASLTLEVVLNQSSVITPENKEEIPSTSTGSLINVPECISSGIPIELWASIGEPFVFPREGKNSKVNESYQLLKLEIDKKKFLLRTMKGERLKKLNPGTLEGTPSEKNPVKIKGNWQFPTADEIKLTEEIENLQNKLNAMKRPIEKEDSKQISLTRDLYKQRHFKNVFVHLNGEREHSSVSVWGECVWDILQNSVSALGMKKTPKYLFNKNGKEVTNFDEISTGETLSVSHHSSFVSSKDSELRCEIRANWGRARRQYGESSTDLKIQYRHNTVIDIDPFEPPDLMKISQELPSEEPKAIRVYENGQPIANAKEITGRSLSDFSRSATMKLGLSVPVKCFYALDGKRISGFKEILHDDLLAASVTGKGFLKSGDS